MALVVCLLLTGCSSHGSGLKTLVDDASVKISTQAHEISVHDKRSGTVYKFGPVLRKRSEAATAPRTAIRTNTFEIINRPGGGLEIHTGQNIYHIERQIHIWKPLETKLPQIRGVTK